MPYGTRGFLQRWVVTTVGVLLAAGVVDGIRAENMVALLAASLLLGVLNAVLRPLLLFLTLPLVIVTLGLFTLVINSLLLYWVGLLVKGFFVASFWSAFKGSILISLVSMFANAAIGRKAVPPPSGGGSPPHRQRGPRPPDTGSGPVIDV